MLKILSLTLLIIGSFGCTSTKLIHVDLDCPGIPKHNVKFTDEEKQSISDSAVQKIDLIITTYKTRIETQCKLINAHNEVHK